MEQFGYSVKPAVYYGPFRQLGHLLRRHRVLSIYEVPVDLVAEAGFIGGVDHSAVN